MAALRKYVELGNTVPLTDHRKPSEIGFYSRKGAGQHYQDILNPLKLNFRIRGAEKPIVFRKGHSKVIANRTSTVSNHVVCACNSRRHVENFEYSRGIGEATLRRAAFMLHPVVRLSRNYNSSRDVILDACGKVVLCRT